MTRFTSLLHKPVAYSSISWHKSQTTKGVRYGLRRTSLLQRIELTRKVRELALQHEFLQAGPISDQLEATLGDLLVQKLYLEWALTDIQGLRIDGHAGTVEMLIEKGPEALSTEIASAIRADISLSEEERKNS